MSGRSMWAKTPTGSKTAVDHLKLLVQIRSTRVAAPTNKIEDAKEAHHGPGHLRKKKTSRTNGSVTLRKTQIGSKKLADRLRPLVPTDPPELVHQVVPETLQFDHADRNHMAGPSGIPSDE